MTGVTASAVCLMLGLLPLLFGSEGEWSDRLLSAGLLILMATPMLRVVVSIVEYVRIREWFFVLTTVIVLTELAVGVCTPSTGSRLMKRGESTPMPNFPAPNPR